MCRITVYWNSQLLASLVFLTEEAQSHSGLQTRELGQTLASVMKRYIHSFPSWLVWSGADINYTLHVALSKWPFKQLKLDQQNKHEALRAYSSNIYTVYRSHEQLLHFSCNYCILFIQTELVSDIFFHHQRRVQMSS